MALLGWDLKNSVTCHVVPQITGPQSPPLGRELSPVFRQDAPKPIPDHPEGLGLEATLAMTATEVGVRAKKQNLQ